MNRCYKNIISYLISISLIVHSTSWALGDIDIPSNLAPRTSATAIVEKFRDEASSLAIVKSTVKWGITSNKDLEESIWKALFNNRYERLFEIGYFSGKRCLIFNGAIYIFSRDRPVIYRFSRKKGIDDPFGKILKRSKGELTTRKIGGRLYYRRRFIVTEGNLEFINSCIQTLYPEWGFRCRIPEDKVPAEAVYPEMVAYPETAVYLKTAVYPETASRGDGKIFPGRLADAAFSGSLEVAKGRTIGNQPNKFFLFTMLFLTLFQSFCGRGMPTYPDERAGIVSPESSPQVYPSISIDMLEGILFRDLDFLDENVRGRLLKVLYILTYQKIPTIKELDSFSIRDAIFRALVLGTPEEIGEELFYAIYTLSDDSTDKGRTAKLIGYKYTKEDLEAAQKPLDYERFKEICDYFGIPYDIVLSIWFIETEGFNRLAVNTYGKKNRDVHDEGLGQIKYMYAVRFWTGEADDLKVLLDKELPGWTDRDKKKKDYNPFDWGKNLMVQCAMLNHLYHRLEKFCTKDGKLMIERDELWRLVIICYHLGENGLIRKAVKKAMDVASKEGRLVTIGDILENIKPEKYRKRAVYYEGNTCSVHRSIGNLGGTGGNILKWEGVTDEERSGIRDRIIKKIFRRQKRKDNNFVSEKVKSIIPVINSAITGIKPEIMGETFERAILGLLTNAKKQGILTERKARLILGELKSLGDWAKSIELGEFLSIAIDKLENSRKIGFRGFVEKKDRFFLGGSVNRKGKDYLLYDVDFLRHLSGLGRGSEYLVSEYFFHEAMELVCDKHQISRLLALLLFPQNYYHVSEDRKIYFPHLRRDIRTFVVLNTFASEYFPRRGFWDWIKGIFKVGIILFIPSIAYGKGFGVYLVSGLHPVLILAGILGIILLFIIIPRYIRHVKNENIKRGIVEIIKEAIELYPPGEMGQCIGASKYVKGRINDEFPALETKSIQCFIPLSPDKPFYSIGETGGIHSATEVKIGDERYIVDTQLKQFAKEWALPEGFVNKYIYPWDEYFLAIPVYADKGCRERILPDNLVNITKNFWAWAESHSARETSVEEANDYLYSIIDERLNIPRNGIRAIYQETILRYFAEEHRKLAESLRLIAMDYEELGMDLDSAICDEHAGKIYFELVYKEDAVRSLNHASKGYSRLGRYGKAGECCEYIARICELFEDKQGEARAWALAGGNYYKSGDFEKAAECDKKAAVVDEQLGNLRAAVKGWDLARKNYLSVWIEFVRKNYSSAGIEEEAAECLKNIARLDEEIGDRAEQEERYSRYRAAIKGYKELALIYYRQGRYSKAGDYSSRAARVQEKIGLKKDAAKSWSLAANSYQLAEEFKMAGDCYVNAGRLDRELGAIRGAIKTFSLAVECYRKAGMADAVEDVQKVIDEIEMASIPDVPEEPTGKGFPTGISGLPLYTELEFITHDEKLVINNANMFNGTGRLIGFSGVYTDIGKGLEGLIESSVGNFCSLTNETGFSNYLVRLLDRPWNAMPKQIQIKIARTNPQDETKKGLGRNEVRYYIKDLNTAIIVFDEEFIGLLLRYKERFPEAVAWIFIERLLHSLCHNNTLADEIDEDARIILTNDLPLYESFVYGSELGKKIDDFWDNLADNEKMIMQSRGLFRMLDKAVKYKREMEVSGYKEQRITDELLTKYIRPYLRGEFLINKDNPGEFINDAPEGFEIALKGLVDKYGPGIIVPVDGIKLESGIPKGDAVLDGKWIKISPESIGDNEILFSALERGFLQRILSIIGGDKEKLRHAIDAYNDVIMARNAIDPAKRVEVETKIKLILSGLTPGQLRFITALKDYTGLPEIISKPQPRYVRFDIDYIDDECLSTITELTKYTRDGIRCDKPVSPDDRLFLFSFYSSSNSDVDKWLTGHKLEQDDIEGIKMGITLLSPDKLREESRDPKDKRYLVLPYSKKSIHMAADLILNYENLVDSEAYGVIKVLYKELIGKEPSTGDILELIHHPWLVLPEPEVLDAFFNGLIKAEEILMSSA